MASATAFSVKPATALEPAKIRSVNALMKILLTQIACFSHREHSIQIIPRFGRNCKDALPESVQENKGKKKDAPVRHILLFSSSVRCRGGCAARWRVHRVSPSREPTMRVRRG